MLKRNSTMRPRRILKVHKQKLMRRLSQEVKLTKERLPPLSLKPRMLLLLPSLLRILLRLPLQLLKLNIIELRLTSTSSLIITVQKQKK
jgi:hypothetical protein